MLIPTRGRLQRLRECLGALAHQSAGSHAFEVLIGVDGPDEGEGALADEVLHDVEHTVLAGEARGPAATRNALIERAQGDVLLFLNDDVVPMWDLVARHLDAQGESSASGDWEHGAMILGSAPWRVEEPDRVVDRLVRETSLIFFYDQMVGDRARDPAHDWGFRHAWTLNLSAPAAAVRAVDGFNDGMGAPVYEDVEFAHRMTKRLGMPVLYRAGAMVEHVHRYEPEGLLRREVLLGHQGYRLAQVSPACALDVFGYDHLGDAEIGRARAYVGAGGDEAERNIRAWLSVAVRGASALDGDGVVDAVFGLYKAGRGYLRRLGWVGAGEGKPVDEVVGWLERFES